MTTYGRLLASQPRKSMSECFVQRQASGDGSERARILLPICSIMLALALAFGGRFQVVLTGYDTTNRDASVALTIEQALAATVQQKIVGVIAGRDRSHKLLEHDRHVDRWSRVRCSLAELKHSSC